MDSDRLPDEIARLEERIEALAEAAERSRKIMTGANGAAALGALGLVAMVLGIVDFSGPGLLFALAGVLGGVVLAGSSSSTLAETRAQIDKAQALRSQMIDAVDPTVVEPPPAASDNVIAFPRRRAQR